MAAKETSWLDSNIMSSIMFLFLPFPFLILIKSANNHMDKSSIAVQHTAYICPSVNPCRTPNDIFRLIVIHLS